MTIRILAGAIGIVLLLANPGWAQSSTATTASFDTLSPGNQKIANALFSAQNTTGTNLTPLTKDQIAGLKGTEGWGKVFKEMKADGLVQGKNLGQVVSAHQHQLNAARRGSGGATPGTARGGRSTLASARMHGASGMTNGRGFAGGSHGNGMGGGGFGHAGMGGAGMGGGGFGHAGMGGGGMGGAGMGGGGMGGGHGGGGGHGR